MGNVTVALIGYLFKEQRGKNTIRKKKGWGVIPSFSCTSPPLESLCHYVTKMVSLVHPWMDKGMG
jgi:hypothetical protein